MTTTMPPKCKLARADGTPCRANARPASDFCIFHDPEMTERRAEARRNGGRSRKAAVLSDAEDLPVRSAADVTALLATTINEVRKGKLDPRIGNAVGYLAGILLRALETGDLAEQVAALRNRIEGVQHGDGSAEIGSGTPAGGGGGPRA
ncbi:MAG TPA: hypothetical protein VMS17_14875 [Gemmataceae bacterium]|nr:hypothetical protein [Gemmataceae bacterium]